MRKSFCLDFSISELSFVLEKLSHESRIGSHGGPTTPHHVDGLSHAHGPLGHEEGDDDGRGSRPAHHAAHDEHGRLLGRARRVATRRASRLGQRAVHVVDGAGEEARDVGARVIVDVEAEVGDLVTREVGALDDHVALRRVDHVGGADALQEGETSNGSAVGQVHARVDEVGVGSSLRVQREVTATRQLLNNGRSRSSHVPGHGAVGHGEARIAAVVAEASALVFTPLISDFFGERDFFHDIGAHEDFGPGPESHLVGEAGLARRRARFGLIGTDSPFDVHNEQDATEEELFSSSLFRLFRVAFSPTDRPSESSEERFFAGFSQTEKEKKSDHVFWGGLFLPLSCLRRVLDGRL